MRRLAFFAAAALVAGLAPAGPAAARDVPHKLNCSSVWHGNICIDVVGKPGQPGTVTVRYRRNAGLDVTVRLGWRTDVLGAQSHFGPAEIVPAGRTRARTWETPVPAGCVQPLVQDVSGRGLIHQGSWLCRKQRIPLADLNLDFDRPDPDFDRAGQSLLD